MELLRVASEALSFIEEKVCMKELPHCINDIILAEHSVYAHSH
jgi:hypothetical protein